MMKNLHFLFTVVATVSLFASCKKNDTVAPDPLSSFSTYDVYEGKMNIGNKEPATFKIPIGISAKATKDTRINYSITSKTGAVQGVQYNLSSKDFVTIKAGSATDTLVVSGIYEGYTQTRIDTLVFKITGGDVNPTDSDEEFTLIIRRFCPLFISDLLGQYRQVTDYENGQFIYGPYECTVTEVYPGTFGTKDTLSISNFWEYGNAVMVVVDFTDPFNITTQVIESLVDVNPEPYAAIHRRNGQVIPCDGIIGLNYSLMYLSDGYVSPEAYSTILRR